MYLGRQRGCQGYPRSYGLKILFGCNPIGQVQARIGMLIDSDAYDRCFRGFTVVDAVIRNRNIFCFVILSNYDNDDVPPPDGARTTRIIPFFLRETGEKRWRIFSYKGLDGLRAGASQKPEEKFVGVDTEGYVVAIGGGSKEIEQEIPRGMEGPRRGGVRKVRTIDGFAYVCTGYRGLGRRDGRNQWTSLCAGLNFVPDPNLTSADYGFDDFDAFDGQDFYCVGGSGDVWNFDGKIWKQLQFPSDMPLEAVCCAGDGWVYIGGADGAVWKGRGDKWTLIHDETMTLPFKDMVWFQDRVYCTSDYGLWEIVDDELRESDVPPGITICSGNLSVADGVMLLAGVYGASYHDGQGWRQIFNTAAF
jgi:hypothetical protein